MQIEIKVIRFKDWRDKTSYFLQIQNERAEKTICIGKTTFEAMAKIVGEFTDVSDKGMKKEICN